MLYQPCPEDITGTIAKARARLPHAGSRLDKAAAILADVNTHLREPSGTDDAHWAAHSCTHPDAWYTVSVDTGCTCPDYTAHAAAAPDYLCKHLLAYHAYRRILVTELNRRIVGDVDYSSDRRRAELDEALILTDTRRPHGQPPAALAFVPGRATPQRICDLRKDAANLWRPRTDADFAALAAHLATAPELEAITVPELPTLAADLPDAREWQPAMTVAQYHRWLATGELISR